MWKPLTENDVDCERSVIWMQIKPVVRNISKMDNKITWKMYDKEKSINKYTHVADNFDNAYCVAILSVRTSHNQQIRIWYTHIAYNTRDRVNYYPPIYIRRQTHIRGNRCGTCCHQLKLINSPICQVQLITLNSNIFIIICVWLFLPHTLTRLASACACLVCVCVCLDIMRYFLPLIYCDMFIIR